MADDLPGAAHRRVTRGRDAVSADAYSRRIGPTPLPLFGLDIETDTTIDGLDPAVAPIVAIAVAGPDTDVVLDGPDERTMLVELDALLAGLAGGALVTWNGAGFDLPFIATRAQALGVPLGLQIRYDASIPGRHDPLPGHPGRVRGTWHRLGHIDGYQAYRSDVGRVLPVSCGLKSLARLVGLPLVEVDRAAIHLLSEAERRAYVASDAALARALVERRADALRWIDQVSTVSGS